MEKLSLSQPADKNGHGSIYNPGGTILIKNVILPTPVV